MAFISFPPKVALSFILSFVVSFFVLHELSAAKLEVSENFSLTVLILIALFHAVWAHKIISSSKIEKK